MQKINCRANAFGILRRKKTVNVEKFQGLKLPIAAREQVAKTIVLSQL